MNFSTMLQDKKRRKIIIAAFFLLLLILQLTVLCYFGGRKSGFHEDEFYSFYSTNKTAGLFVNDRQWIDTESFRNDFVVLKGEQFRYSVVKQMQSWDVHPPLYYYILHTVCSFFPGVFSKWLGISVNLIAFAPCFLLLAYLVYTCVAQKEKEESCKKAVFLAFAVCLAWGFSAAVISGVMFIRMYQWLTLFVLLCASLHVRAIKKQDCGIRFLLPLGITVFLGFMTQYYYIIFHFFMGAAFCILLLKEKKIKELFAYALSCALGLGAAIIYYPSCLAHIFRGYRGTEAVSEFSNTGNTMERLKFFVQLFDEYVVNGTLCVILLLIFLFGITVSYAAKRGMAAGTERPDKEQLKTRHAFALLVLSSVGYFIIVSKTALLLGETSNRYQLPVYGLLIFILLLLLCLPVDLLISGYEMRKNNRPAKKCRAALMLFLTGAILLTDGLALKGGKVFFLYEEEASVMEYVKENREVPIVVFYNEASPDNVWRLSDELMEFPEVYLASQGNTESITDEKINGSSKLLVYVADYDDSKACLENLLSNNEKLTGYQVIAEKGLWTLYEMNG